LNVPAVGLSKEGYRPGTINSVHWPHVGQSVTPMQLSSPVTCAI